METMLAPEPSTLDDIYDEERAREMFVPGHNVVAIDVRELKEYMCCYVVCHFYCLITFLY